jgi:hypothetical protein
MNDIFQKEGSQSQEGDQLRDETGEWIADAERRAQSIVEAAKELATQEGNKIIQAAAVEARAMMLRHGESVTRDGGIQRLIEFPAELRQAGISILSYFSEILKQKYPDQEMTVRIEQFGTLVRMTVDSPSGWRDVVEKDLATYGEVVKGAIGPESLLHNEVDVLRLSNKLDIAKVELEFERRVNTLTLANSSDRISSLEYQLDQLHKVIAMSLTPRDDSMREMADLLKQYSSNEVLLQALIVLSNHLSNPSALAHRKEIEAAAKTISDNDPSVLRRVYDILSSTASGTAGTLLASWIESLLK